jgi:hypothetical protein
MIFMRAITLQYLNEQGEDVAINIAAETRDGDTVRISRVGPAPGDDPRARRGRGGDPCWPVRYGLVPDPSRRCVRRRARGGPLQPRGANPCRNPRQR